MILVAFLIFVKLLDHKTSCQPGLYVVYVNSSSPLAVNDSSCWTGGSLRPCSNFDLGLEGIHRSGRGKLLIAGPGNYTLIKQNFTDFSGTNDLTIAGVINSVSVLQKPQVVVNCSFGVGLSFVMASNITVSGITFWACGALRTSTSYNMKKDDPAFVQFYVGLYFMYCRNLNLTFIEVVHTPGTGVVIYNTVGSNVIKNSTFSHNNFQEGNGYSGGGGLYIEFSYCDIFNTNCLKDNMSNVKYEYTHDSKFVISYSYFIDNHANISTLLAKTESFILPYGHYHVAFGRGGGLSFYINGNANRNRVIIEKCVVINNTALWGAGILMEFHDQAQNNTFEITGSVIQGNCVRFNESEDQGTGGGGVRLGMFMLSKNDSLISGNRIVFNESIFERNIAYYGGGFSFYSTKTNIYHLSNKLEFLGCKFFGNSARLGAAIDISLLHFNDYNGNPVVKVSDCEFYLNIAFYKNRHGQLVGVGTMYVEAIPVIFTGSSSFSNNSGSGIAVTGTYIEIHENSVLSFLNNSGRYGGGMNLLSNAYMVTFPNSTLRFIRNTAEFSGGAIYYYHSGERDLVGSGNCFIKYSNIFVPKEDWTSNFHFDSNSADGISNAIYASTVLPCVHGGIQWNTSVGSEKTFCWNDRWIYKDENEENIKCRNFIKTAPSKYSVQKSYQAIPGEVFPLKSKVYDDYSNEINAATTTFLLKIMDGNGSFESEKSVDNEIMFLDQVKVYGQSNSNVKVQIETVDPVVIQDTFTIELQDCPPGFNIQGSTGFESCVCANDYSGYLRCNQNNFTSSILRSMWMGSVSHHNELLVGDSPRVFMTSNLIYIPMPKNSSALDDFFCGKNNATGVLCGSCINGFGISVFDSDTSACVPCPKYVAHYHWLFYILVRFVPILIFFGIVFIFSMTVTVGPLNSYIFFAQLINTVTKINADGMIELPDTEKQVHRFLNAFYDLWNLKFFDSWLPKFCLSPSLNTLDIHLVGYLRAIFPLVLLLFFIVVVHLYNQGNSCVVASCRPFHRCLARFRQAANLRKSVTGGIATFILISYTQITLVSLLILMPARLHNADGKVVDYVFYYNGDVPYRWSSVQYIIPAVTFICIFVLIPPLLLAYPTFLNAVSYFSHRKFNVEKFYPGHKMQAFLDEFHGCYRNGSSGGIDCRWFSSLYFILRIILIVVYVATDTWMLQYTIQIMFLLIAVFLFSFIRPYRNDWINSLDVSMFLLLIAISTISFFNLTSTWSGKTPDVYASGIQCIFVATPLIYCTCYFCILLCCSAKPCQSVWKRYTDKKSKNKTRQLKVLCNEPTVSNENSSNPKSGLEDSTHVPDFLDFVNSSRLSHSPYSTQTQQDYLQTLIPTTSTSNNMKNTESSYLLGKEELGRHIEGIPDNKESRKSKDNTCRSAQSDGYGTCTNSN